LKTPAEAQALLKKAAIYARQRGPHVLNPYSLRPKSFDYL